MSFARCKSQTARLRADFHFVLKPAPGASAFGFRLIKRHIGVLQKLIGVDAAFGANYILASVRAEHQAFYRRRFRYEVVSGPRPYPLLAKPISLVTLHFPSHVREGLRQYPFFRSTFFERRMLFERWRAQLPSEEARSAKL